MAHQRVWTLSSTLHTHPEPCFARLDEVVVVLLLAANSAGQGVVVRKALLDARLHDPAHHHACITGMVAPGLTAWHRLVFLGQANQGVSAWSAFVSCKTHLLRHSLGVTAAWIRVGSSS